MKISCCTELSTKHLVFLREESRLEVYYEGVWLLAFDRKDSVIIISPLHQYHCAHHLHVLCDEVVLKHAHNVDVRMVTTLVTSLPS